LRTVKVAKGVGRPRTRPRELVADKGQGSDAPRKRLRARGIRPCIPRRRNAQPRPGRKANLSGYRERWVVERTFAWLGNFRRLVVRWERRAHVYLAFLLLACILILLRAISG
jgi:transposase